MTAPFRAGWNGSSPDDSSGGSTIGMGQTAASPAQQQPAWAKRLHRRQQITQAATTSAHTLRGGDSSGAGSGPSLRNQDE
jgi:type IV secretion system protein TrbL